MVRNLGLDMANCRGQSYDNASNMSGKYNGLQAHLKKVNPLIHYTPCAAHSLNLVGVNTIEDCSADVISFFDLLQSLYAFCSASTHRWNTVFKNDFSISHTLKSLCGTRWSCRADSMKNLCRNYRAIRDSLAKISSDSVEKERCKRFYSHCSAMLSSYETSLQSWKNQHDLSVLHRIINMTFHVGEKGRDLLTRVTTMRRSSLVMAV